MNRNITATILIVIALGLYFTITTDVLDEIKAVQEVNNKYISAIEGAKELIKVRDKVLNDYNNLTQENRIRLEKMLPKNVDNIRLIIDMNNLATRYGFNLKDIDVSVNDTDKSKNPSGQGSAGTLIGGGAVSLIEETSVIPTPVLDTVTIKFSVDASYQQFIGFLQDLEANLRIMDVTRMTATVDDSGVYDWSLEIKTYWLRSQ